MPRSAQKYSLLWLCFVILLLTLAGCSARLAWRVPAGMYRGLCVSATWTESTWTMPISLGLYWWRPGLTGQPAWRQFLRGQSLRGHSGARRSHRCHLYRRGFAQGEPGRRIVTNANFSGADMSGATLTRVDLTTANLTAVVLNDARLIGVWLWGTRLQGRS